ncbi:Cyclin-A1-1 [Phytophthora ramorum]|uniref:Cyclin-A1-1 n=1 Tax=Phytophthora ramorum TaxID=164328 RepID=UPI0030B3485C|nr:Cyclin-A1-1 [Phytophthora ramorum]
MERHQQQQQEADAARDRQKAADVSKAADVAKPRASTRRKSAGTSVNSALKNTKSFTDANKANKRVAVAKKTVMRAKKRKLEGVENQPPHGKIQTVLAFPKPQVKREADKETERCEEEETQEQQAGAVVAATAAEPHDEYAPRPYKFVFDHSSSCFAEKTYAAEVRDIDAPSDTVSSHHAKLVLELDAYYKKHEMKYLPEADYIGTVQVDINEKMRTILVDWLVEVGEEYELDSQTFHKAVNLVDRCLKEIKINRKQFQLLGCACMMIAAKFEEVHPPNVEEFVYISDQTYTAEEMLDMETQVLNALEYRVASTTCYGFMYRYMKAGCNTDEQRSLVSYLCDFALLSYHMVRFKPSKLVASAVYLARVTAGEAEPWTPTLHHVTKYNPSEIQGCVEEHRLHAIESQVVTTQRDKAKAVSEKYLAEKFQAASTVPACCKDKLTESFGKYSSS